MLLRRAAFTLVAVVVGLAATWLTLTLTRPSDDELQRAALDELGLPVGMESSPIIGPVLDDITEQITRRMINESRASATVAALLGIVVAVGVGSGMDLLESHRRARQPDNRAGSTSAELHDGDR
ncbi:hypothetical protein [Actinospongicola halichondriae]|uniref:hypothetical protein n=1 Tax=Actinospongicola halichondriae TaxID=3236844 RepID=UPI003D3A5848